MKKPGLPVFLANLKLQNMHEFKNVYKLKKCMTGVETEKANSLFWKTNKIFKSKVSWEFNNKNQKCYSIFFAQNS